MEQGKYFYCYNVYLSRYLESKGIKHITMARELKNNKIFTMYEQTEELSNAMREYKLSKHSN